MESMDLGHVVKPMVDLEGGPFVGSDLSRSKAGSKEDTSCVGGNMAFNCELHWDSFFISDVELD